MSMIDFPKIDSQGFFHDWNGFAMDRFNDPHLPSAGFTRRGVDPPRMTGVSIRLRSIENPYPQRSIMHAELATAP